MRSLVRLSARLPTFLSMLLPTLLPTLVVALALTAGCSGVTSPTVGLAEEFTLAPGDRVRIAGTNTMLTFLGVEGDSRCPADAFCIQGGDAQVNVEVVSTAGLSRYALHTGDLKPVTHEGLTIALVTLSPYPFSSRTIAPADYRATLAVRR